MRVHKTNKVLAAAVLAIGTFALDSALAVDAKTSLVIEIGPQSLEAALLELSKQGHLQLVIATGSLPAKISVPLHGSMPLGVALDLLLKGTGLTYKLVGDHTIAIVKSDGLTRQLPDPPASPGVAGVTDPASPVPQHNAATDAGGKDATKGEPAVSHPGLLVRLATLLGICVSAVQGPVCAQSTSASDAPSGGLAEIIVTAQKRAEDLQSVPVSVQVVGGPMLAEQNYNTLEDLARIVPTVHVSTGAFSNTLSMRGIASGSNPGFDQSVATFDDDIYHGRSRMSEATFLDLDRIEVLKGPQSTFFGNNAIAGALNIVTKKPGDTFDAWGRLLYGQFGQYAMEGAVGGPVTDTLSARLAVTRNGESGWIDNLNTGQHAPDENNEAARLTLVYRPNENLDATFKVEGGENRVSGAAYDQPLQWYNCSPPAPFTIANSTTVGQGGCPYVLAHGLPVGLANNNVSELAGQGSRLSSFEDVLTVNYRQWEHTFSSITGFYNYHSDESVSEDGTPLLLVEIGPKEKYHQFSQELRIASPTDQRIEYLAGAYFQTDELNFDDQSNVPALTPIIEVVPPFAPLIPYTPFGAEVIMPQTEHIYSVFGALRWNLTDHLKLNAGLRGSWVNKDATQTVQYGTSTQTFRGQTPIPADLQPLGSFLYGTPGTVPLSQSDNAWMPSAGIKYQIDPRVMAYFSYSKGFKAGGFNATSEGGQTPQQITFGPEHVNAYELGLKGKWFEDTLLVNLDVFRSNYQDLQVNAQTLNPATNTYLLLTRNAAQSVSQGVELETQWLATKNLQLGANVTYLESYYVSFPNASPTTLQSYCAGSYVLPYCSVYPNPVPQFANLSGQTTNYAPRWSGNLTGSYSVVFPADYKLTTVIAPYFSSSYNNQDPYLIGTSAYVRLDARMTFSNADGRWAVDLIGKNLTNRIIITSLDSQYSVAKEEPRNIAVQVRYHW
jgi:iron complex outermembrane recepter protein